MQYEQLPDIVSAEALAQRFHHRLYLQEFGTLISPVIPLEEIKRVLVVFCGSGAWAIDTARAYPRMHVVGVESSIELIRMAQEDAHVAGLANVTFEPYTSLEKLSYAEGSFDLIYIPRANVEITPSMWPPILHEWLRVLRPGGWLQMVDFDLGPVSSPSFDRLITYLLEARTRVGHTLPNSLSVAVLYPRLLTQAGCSEVKYTLHALDLGNQKNNIGRNYALAVLASEKRITQFISRMGVTTLDEAQSLLSKVWEEVQQLDYCALGMLTWIVGMKPEA